MMLPVGSISPNPYQPRRSFEEESLAALAESIRTHGMLQPVLVAERQAADGGKTYHLIAGERRLRAARKAGASEIPCILRREEGASVLELALVENIHRTELGPLERASAYRDLMDRFNLTQEQVAEKVGEPRATIANYLRLLDLCDEVQAHIASGRLTFGHAKVLAGLAGDVARQAALAKAAVQRGLSVRALEELVEQAKSGGGGDAGKEGQSPKARPPYVLEVERQLSQGVGTKVSIRPGRARHSGRIVIEYYSLEDFDRIVAALGASIES
jgi:ParB family chromosome partitioning protein